MFEEYAFVEPMTLEQTNHYLERIGYQGDRIPTKEVLDELVYCHQCSVPFETLDPHEFHKAVSLKPEDLYDKIVRRRRGGYCLELNASFYRLLTTLGFQVRPCLCRVLLGSGENTHPIDHRTNLVCIDGREYFCDVGLGGPMPAGGLDTRTEEWQNLRGEEFCVRADVNGWYAIVRKTRGLADVHNDLDVAERVEILFTMIQCYSTDVMFLNHYMSSHPEALHVQHRILNRRTEEGYCAIMDDVFKEVKNGKVVHREIGDDLCQILSEKFGIYV